MVIKTKQSNAVPSLVMVLAKYSSSCSLFACRMMLAASILTLLKLSNISKPLCSSLTLAPQCPSVFHKTGGWNSLEQGWVGRNNVLISYTVYTDQSWDMSVIFQTLRPYDVISGLMMSHPWQIDTARLRAVCKYGGGRPGRFGHICGLQVDTGGSARRKCWSPWLCQLASTGTSGGGLLGKPTFMCYFLAIFGTGCNSWSWRLNRDCEYASLPISTCQSLSGCQSVGSLSLVNIIIRNTTIHTCTFDSILHRYVNIFIGVLKHYVCPSVPSWQQKENC